MDIYTGTKHEQQGGSNGKRKKFEPAVSYLDTEWERESRIKNLRLATPLAFAYGRLRFVNAHLALRHGGPCLTDDGVVYSELMMPFAVEIAHLDRASSFAVAMRRFRYWLPKYVDEVGADGLASQWDDLCQMRSIAKAHNRTESEVGQILWLPTAEQIRANLRPTGAERDALNRLYPDRPPARGVGVIDPPTIAEARARDRDRKMLERRKAGVRPMSTRTVVAEREALAVRIGCSARTLERHEKAGTLDAFIAKRGGNVENVSARYIMGDTPGQVFDIPEDNPLLEVAAMFRDIRSDFHA